MRLSVLFAAALLATPATMRAQPAHMRIILPEIKKHDLHSLDPANVLLQNRGLLALDKSQIARLDSLRAAFEDRADRLADSIRISQKEVATLPPELKRLPDDHPRTHKDSVKYREIDSTNTARTDEYEQRTARGRRDLSAALLALKAFYDDTGDKGNGILTPEQRVKANRPIADASDRLTSLVRRANIR
jgi:hypothetical protein